MTINRKQARKIWKRVMRGTGYRCRFVYYKRISKITGLGQEVTTALIALSLIRRDFFEGGGYMTVVLPNGQTYIITPQKIGDKGPPRRQVATLAHELQHYLDFGGSMGRMGIYITDGDHRANFEARGEAAGADLYRYMSMPVPKAKDIFDAYWMETYMCSFRQADFAKKYYNSMIQSHKSGEFATEAGAIVAKAVEEVCG
jgi:hypothetical protein